MTKYLGDYMANIRGELKLVSKHASMVTTQVGQVLKAQKELLNELNNKKNDNCRCQNRRISGRGSRTVRLGSMVTGDGGHNVYPGSGPLYAGNTLLPA